MTTASLPIPMARAALNLLPRPMLERAVEIVLARMNRRRPKLFKNLAELPRAVVHLMPTDAPYGFALTLGQAPVTFMVIDKDAQEAKADACIKGSLEALVDMLEGRADGDMLFFSRDIQITGDTSVIVGLRNTLDREEINLLTEVTSLCGPFAESARLAVTLADRLACSVRAHLSALKKAG